MGRGTWKNFEPILWSWERGGGGSQFTGLGVPQRKDMKHVNKGEDDQTDRGIENCVCEEENEEGRQIEKDRRRRVC